MSIPTLPSDLPYEVDSVSVGGVKFVRLNTDVILIAEPDMEALVELIGKNESFAKLVPIICDDSKSASEKMGVLRKAAEEHDRRSN